MTSYTAEHLSGRFDVEPAQLREALVKQLADDPDFVSHTEMSRNARAAVLTEFPEYGVVKFEGPDGQDECALQYRFDGPKPIASKVVKLSDLPIPRRGDNLCFALYVRFPDHHRIILHMPSGVEGANGFLDNAQARVYRNAIGGLKRFVATLDGPVAITGDWNLSLRKAWVRTYLAEAFPKFTTTWLASNLPELGTHGSRVIDFSLVRGFTVASARVVTPFGASDHRGVRETLDLKENPVTIPDPYAHTTFRQRPLDWATVARLKQAEARLGYELTIVQGIGGAAASAGTHTEGRAVDLAAYDYARKVKVLRDLGFAAWYRPYRAGVWGAHIHAVLIFETRLNSRGLADSAVRQIGSYDRGRDGLAGDGPDPNPYRPEPKVTFTRAQYEATFAAPREVAPKPTNVTKVRDKLVESIHDLGQAIALLDQVDERRVRVLEQRDEIVAARKSLKAILAALPER